MTVWEIRREQRESDDDEETFFCLEYDSWIFTTEEKMRTFLEKQIRKEQAKMEKTKRKLNFGFKEYRFGLNKLSWGGVIGNGRRWVQTCNIFVTQKETDPINEETAKNRQC